MIETTTMLKKLRKDIISTIDLDFFELQGVLDPENENKVSFRK